MFLLQNNSVRIAGKICCHEKFSQRYSQGLLLIFELNYVLNIMILILFFKNNFFLQSAYILLIIYRETILIHLIKCVFWLVLAEDFATKTIWMNIEILLEINAIKLTSSAHFLLFLGVFSPAFKHQWRF